MAKKPKSPAKPSKGPTREHQLETTARCMRKILANKGWTASYWATRAGMGRAGVTNYINEVSLPGYNATRRLADAAGVSLVEVCPFYEDMGPSEKGIVKWTSSSEDPTMGRLEVRKDVHMSIGMQIVELLKAQDKASKS